MKILLVNPTNTTMGHWPPLGLAYLAAMLELRNVVVKIVDRNIFVARKQDPDHATEEEIIREKPDFVGISATTPLIVDAFRVAGIAKRAAPGVRVLLGGTHANVLPFETLDECPDIDAVCMGEGEDTVLDIAAGKPFEEIDGMVFRNGNRVVSNSPRRARKDLDSLPFPARHLLDMRYYTSTKVQVIRGLILRATHLFTARGCPFKCTFCAGSSVFGRGVRFHSSRYVLEEMIRLVEKYDLEGLYFAEDMFLANKKRAREICEGILERGLQKKVVWAAQVRPDVIDEEILGWMKRAGCIQLEFGFESGSQRILDRIGKRTTVTENIRVVNIAKEKGFRIVANMLVGIPGERRQDLQATIDFIETIRPEFVGFNRLIPLPGSEIFDTLHREGRINRNWSQFHFGADNFDNAELNFTEMRTEEIEELAGHFARSTLRRRHVWNYLVSNLLRHPIRVLPRMISVGWENRQLVTRMVLGK